jgi:hypothetical protein
MSSRDELQRIFDEAASSFAASNRKQLSYDDMLDMADVFEGWAQDERISVEKAAMILGWAEGLRRLADEVGPEWNPPEPDKLNIMGFIARKIAET